MRSLFSLFLFLFLFLFLSVRNHLSPATATTQSNIICQTCQRCADSSPNVNYTLCVSSLSGVPSSHRSNLTGLSIISVKLAVINASKVLSKVKQLLKTPPADPYTKSCLQTCRDVYTDGISSLKDSIPAIKTGLYQDVNAWISSAMDAPGTCEDCFTDGNVTSPLTEEDNGFFQLAVISLAVAALLG